MTAWPHTLSGEADSLDETENSPNGYSRCDYLTDGR
jgi:hypothetical protein